MPVTVVVARNGEVTERIPVVGSLAAKEEVQVHSLVQGQVIEKILVESGDYVKKGQALAVLDTTDAHMQLEKNLVRMRRAKAAVSVEARKVDVARVSELETRKTLERSRALHPKGAVSQQLLDEHENAHARALAEMSLARQSLVLAEADAEIIARERREIELTIGRSTLRAPEAGLVLRRSARIGAMTSGSGTPLFVIAKDAAIEFVAKVTETSFVRLSKGMRADIALPGHERPVGGTVRLHAAELDATTRSGEVRIELDAVDGLKPGIFVRGNINTSARRNIILPGSAVRTAGGSSSVLVVEGDVVGTRQVSVGARQDGQVEIIGGINDGEMIVLKSGGFLKPADRVLPVMAADRSSQDDLAASLATTAEAGAVQ
ncbi:efflux RND transporter periplasmic adaptor subunit [Rhizobium halophilum]|uniref:efflux RND transporter periplasmic adaptor subunit n=1 Tax=Rhizobium halophilum TaxID=2846852 RepID=UPI001EFE4958|nr:efflux RND transporter periplasmic adaptor subunit [Rhizobium halophilum]MCF6369691.1 efflux RND transporter periplasmic adaptor subunit [Rhizobium halophilum]